jgi:Cupin domain
MPKASKATASESMTLEGYEGHFAHFEGGYSVGFETYTADADLAPLFKGLPDDRCQCPHWGYVIKGRVRFTFGDGREETYEAGDAYYAPPGHTPYLFAGSEVVEFHPTAKLEELMEVVERNMAATEA